MVHRIYRRCMRQCFTDIEKMMYGVWIQRSHNDDAAKLLATHVCDLSTQASKHPYTSTPLFGFKLGIVDALIDSLMEDHATGRCLDDWIPACLD